MQEQPQPEDINKEESAPIAPPLSGWERRRLRREAALDQIFGKDRPSMWSNIWGWRMSLIGLFVLVFTTVAAIIGTQKGYIRWDEPRDRSIFVSPSDVIKPAIKDTNKDTKKDSI
jgi:hypothetical protein